MAIKITSNVSTTNNYVTINYTADETITKIELTKDGTNFITAINFSQVSALFNIESWGNGTYNNCYLRATVSEQSTAPVISLATINNMTINKGEVFNILYTTNIPAVKHEFSWNGGSTFWNKTSEIAVSNSTNYKYTHEAKTDVSSYNMAIRVTDANGNTSTKTFTITFTQQPIQLNNINNISAKKGESFGISYSTNTSAVKHEVSWDGGSTYWDKTSEISTVGTNTYRYTHEAKTDVSSYNMAIRVTDANGNTSTKTFTITFSSAFDSSFTFTQYKRLNDGIVTDTTDNKYYSTVNLYPVVSGEKYTISINSANYICICYYNSSENYVNYSEANTDDWSVKEFATTITIPSGVTGIRACVTNNGAQVSGSIAGATATTSKITQEAIVPNVTSSNAYTTYSSFFNKVNVNNGIIIPGLKSNMVPQGMCKNGNYIYVSAYDYTKADCSCVYVINTSTKLFEKAIWLKGSTNHVGGITTNGTYLYITCGNRIGIISLSTINSASKDAEITPTYITIKNDTNESVRCSTCVYDSTRNYLWVGQFNENAGDHAYAYTVNGASSLTYKAKIDVPQQTQGLFFEGNTVYYSCSYGRNNASLLYVCNWGGENNDFWYAPQNVIEIPPTSEGIFKEGNLMYVLFENASKHYMNSDNVPTCPVDRIYAYNLQTSSPSTPSTPSGLLDANGAYMLDDFTGTSLDRSKWDYEWGYVRNGELQNYQDTNAVVNNGILELQGRKSNGTWTSASIISKGHFAFMYGKIECRAKIDPTWGSFSAFWTLGDSFEFGYHNWASPDTLGEWWAWCGEFDVMEFYSGNLTCGTFFNDRQESGRVWYNNYDFNAWHIFSMEWLTDGTLIFRIDGNELSRTNPTNNRAFHIPHFILINQAIGASGGTPADSTTAITQYVDWVKYYPLSTNNVVLNSNDFYLTAMDFNDNSHNCMVRPTFNDNCINKSLTWKSSNSSLVWVHSGLCSTYAGANGSVTITATTQGGVSRSITLTVNNGTLR